MEGLIFLLIIAVIAILVMPFIALAKAAGARQSVREMEGRLRTIEAELKNLREGRPATTAAAAPASRAPEPKTAPPIVTEKVIEPTKPLPSAVPPPLPKDVLAAAKGAPPPEPVRESEVPPKPALPSINWEQFMGAKLFAWVGGLALFLGVGFFIKYSFEHNLIPPAIRVAIGFVIGLGLVVGGLALKRKENAVTAQTLCATGILILYAVTFACRSLYHFPFFGLIPTFILMTLITAVAFLLAIRLDAIVVAILGIAGGFLTPILLSSGQDNPLGLFGYIAVLDIGLLLVARAKQWRTLPFLGAAGTILMQAAWAQRFFLEGKYFAGNNTLIPMAIFLAFEFLFSGALLGIKRESKADKAFTIAAIAMGGAALFWAFYFFSFESIGKRPVILLSYIFLADIALIAIAFAKEKLSQLATLTGIVVFVFLAMWTLSYLKADNLYPALAFYFVFALVHTAAPLVMQRVRKIDMRWWEHLFPALSLVLMLMPICSLSTVSFLIWPLVLCVDLLAIVLAAVTGTLLSILVVLLLTFVVIGGWIFRIPTELTGLPTSLFLLGGFAIFFLIAALWASRKFLPAGAQGKLLGSVTQPGNFAVQLPALSATLPFLLLIMVTLRLPLTNPSPVFGLALLFAVLLLGMAKQLSLESLTAVGLISVIALEHAWHLGHFTGQHAPLILCWYIGFAALFTIFPFLFQKRFESQTLVWAVAALAGPLHFFLVYDVIRRAFPNGMLGLIPAAFSIPLFLGLIILLKRTKPDNPARNAQLALFGGAALFFITLIFPIQFERQWITLGWALEGAALCWLFHRIPHPGLKIAGVGLLLVAFARLSLNPAVLSYHARSSTPLFNWFLYTYGITTICFFIAARLLAPPRNIVLGANARPLLYALGTILAFLLLNIEIADYFTKPGAAALTFQFSGSFARDMSYSIAWSLFALLLLIVGIRQNAKPVRYASLALLGVAILKLFFHDLSQLDQLYRIAAFIVVAIIAIVASFLYQRFLGASQKPAQ